MKRTIILFLTAVFLSSVSFADRTEKISTKREIKKTVMIIKFAREKLREGRNFTGDFVKARMHQKAAIIYFQREEFDKALRQTRRARFFAFRSIKANGGKADPIEERGGGRKDLSDTETAAEMEAVVSPQPGGDEAAMKEAPDDIS